MTNPFFGNVPQQKGVAPQAAPSGTTSLTSDIDPIKRAKFTGYLQGMSANAVPPQPPMMPQPMNMGGMVDVFDPMYMNQGGFVISTDDSGKIRTRPVFSEDRGRMVSQIMSRDMVDEMAKAAMAKANQPEPAPPPMVVEPESKLVAIKEMLEDDYESGKGFAETMQPVTTEPTTETTISLPVQKPILSDTDVKGPRRSSIDLPVTKPVIQLPVSKPSVVSEDFTDTPSYERFKADYTDIPNYRIFEGDTTGDEFDLTNRDELNAADMIKRMLSEGEKISGPDTETFDVPRANVRGKYPFELTDEQLFLIDSLMPEQTLDAMNENIPDRFSNEEEEQGISLLAKILNALRPRYNRMGFGEEIGVDRRPFLNQDSTQFNDGGIVQGFSNGGFTSNLRAAEPERAREIEEARYLEDLVGEYDKMYREPRDSDDLGSATPIFQERDSDDLGSATPIFKTVGEGRSPVSGNVYDAYTSTSVIPEVPLGRNEAMQGLIDDMNPITKSIHNIGASVLGYPRDAQGNITPAGLAQMRAATQQTLDPNSMQSRLARDRQLDKERAERKLAEEQRLRDMIQGMLPPTATTAPTTPVADAPTADPATPDYGSVVVPSDRVPGFDVGKISPYPQFRMPTEFSPVFPTSLSANYFKDLFKNIGVQNMQQGGSVNQLDSAIDNFINAYR